MFLGLDYGSRKAGTTVISFIKNRKLYFIQSEKNKDADNYISEFISDHKPEQVFIDSPLSLPKAYYTGEGDFHYRQCDRNLNTMSPMFLGGLTARAISLSKSFSNTQFIETYPKALAHLIDKQNYKDDIEKFLNSMISFSNDELEFDQAPSNWHQVDSYLAFLSGIRYNSGNHIEVGDREEGRIIY